MGRLTHGEYREGIAAKIEAAQEVLASEVAALVSGDDWRHYLGFQARLHVYSANNAMLIAAQHAQAFAEGRVAAPEPSWVAGFGTWKALGRMVEKGQRGYMVLAPVRRIRRKAIDEAGNARRLDRGDLPGLGETEQRSVVVGGFKVEYVFDVSQTHGAELPAPPTPCLLQGQAPAGLGDAVRALIEDRGLGFETAPTADDLGGANGQTRWDARTVVVRSDMDDAAMVKTMIHEAAHVLLHQGPPGRDLPRPLKEVEAESVAFVVASVHGMATDDYSFPYVASWAGDQAARAVSATQARVAGAAQAIIAVSPAEHTPGGTVPGAVAGIRFDGTRARPVTANRSTPGWPWAATGYDAPAVGLGPEVAG